jgi:hypothetical protein
MIEAWFDQDWLNEVWHGSQAGMVMVRCGAVGQAVEARLQETLGWEWIGVRQEACKGDGGVVTHVECLGSRGTVGM